MSIRLLSMNHSFHPSFLKQRVSDGFRHWVDQITGHSHWKLGINKGLQDGYCKPIGRAKKHTETS